MTGEQQAELDAWMRDLSGEEWTVAQRMLQMEGGNHATAFLAVLIHRLEKRSVLKDAWKAVGAVGGVIVAAVASYRSTQ